MRPMVDIKVEQHSLRITRIVVQQAIRDELGTENQGRFGKTEFQLAAQRDLVGVHEAAVCALVYPAGAVVAGGKGGVVENEVDCCEWVLGQTLDICESICVGC